MNQARQRNWQDIYHDWLYRLEDFYMPVDDIAPFEIVQVQSREPFFGVDWWPKSEYQGRLENLKRGHTPYWEIKRGTLHTANLLFESKNNPERQSAVLIMASIDGKMKDMPLRWGDNTYTLMEQIFVTIRQAFPGIQLWHHASRSALPITVERYPVCEFIYPQTYAHLIYVFALETSLSLGNWRLIKYISTQYVQENRVTT